MKHEDQRQGDLTALGVALAPLLGVAATRAVLPVVAGELAEQLRPLLDRLDALEEAVRSRAAGDDLLTQKEAASLLGKSTRTLRRLATDDPSFPPPAQVTASNSKKWRRGDLDRWAARTG